MSTRWQRAKEAYKAILCAPREPNEDGWTPPPSDSIRDKKWSRELRAMWPNYAGVRVDDTRFYSEKIKWCNANAQFYWAANNQQMWYFSEKSAALLFKLTFGGSIEE